ncbi:MAG: cyclic nucleotide-binding domain-containing protein [Chloroflexota bacterium]
MADAQILEVMSKSHLFRNARTSDIEYLAEKAQLSTLEQGKVLFEKGKPARGFYFVIQGRMRLYQKVNEKEITSGMRTMGDYFGLDSLLVNPIRRYYAAADEATLLARIENTDLMDVARQVPRLKAVLGINIKSRRLAEQMRLDWLNIDENVYLIVRHHPIFLFLKMFLSIFLYLGAIALFVFGADSQYGTLFLLGIVLIGVASVWGYWHYIDYINDYYVITNQRVVYLQKVIGLYDSRQEAPMGAIRAVDAKSTWIARIIGYGDVAIRTFTGGIVLTEVNFPHQVIALIDELRERTKTVQLKMKEQVLRQTLRENIGLDKKPPPPPATTAPPYVISKRRIKLHKPFRMRLEEGAAITFRRHWIIFFRKAWLSTIAMILSSAVIIVGLLMGDMQDDILSLTTAIVGVVLLMASFLWTLYHYVDWQNDIYRVTADQILDIERRPFGNEQRKSAPLESILSLNVERKNLIGIMLNFGDVVIDAGGTKLIFKSIYEPTLAQLAISHRMEALKKRKEEALFAEENRRVAEWITMYHREVNHGDHK